MRFRRKPVDNPPSFEIVGEDLSFLSELSDNRLMHIMRFSQHRQLAEDGCKDIRTDGSCRDTVGIELHLPREASVTPVNQLVQPQAAAPRQERGERRHQGDHTRHMFHPPIEPVPAGDDIANDRHRDRD